MREHVSSRLDQENERLIADAMAAAGAGATRQEAEGDPDEPADKAGELDTRRESVWRARPAAQMQPQPPRIVTAALVLPAQRARGRAPADAPMHALETKDVERRGVDLVLAAERALGRKPVEQAFNNPGFDILSAPRRRDPIRIEVKARIDGAEDFFVTHNEVITGTNSAPRYRLALVRSIPDGAEHDEVRYLENPFAGFNAGDFDANGHYGDWDKTWARGQEPF